MRSGLLGSVAGLLAGASLTLAQAPLPLGPAGGEASTVVAPRRSPYIPSPEALQQSRVSPYGAVALAPAPEAAAPIVPMPAPALPLANSAYNPHCDAACGGNGSCGHQCKSGPGCLGCDNGHCDPDLYITGGAEILLWWIKDNRLSIPLVTTGPLESRGIIGQPGTTVIFGNQNLDYQQFLGGRANAQFWHSAERDQGVEVSYFVLGNRSTSFTAASNGVGVPVAAVPFFDVLTNSERASFGAFPGAFAGGVNVTSRSDLWGAEASLLWRTDLASGSSNVWLLGGFRYLDLGEDLVITQGSNILGGGTVVQPDGSLLVLQGGRSGFAGRNIFTPNSVQVRDSFRTRNQFYGGQLGFKAEVQRGDAFAVLTGKIGLGANVQTLEIAGRTAVTPGGPNNTIDGGLLATSTNSGRNTTAKFAAVPEVGLKVGYYLTRQVRGYLGYDFVYWSNVIRPTEQVDRAVNRSRVPTSDLYGTLGGPVRPAMRFNESDFWAHGLNIGMEFSY